MDPPINLVFIFGLGVFIEALLLLRNSFDSENIKKFLISLLAPTIFLIFFIYNSVKDYGEMQLGINLFLYLLVFVGLFALIFRKELLPRIDECVVLSFTILFWYSFISYFYANNPLANFIAAVAIIPSIGIFVVSFTKTNPNKYLRLFFYVWFLVCIISLGATQFSLEHMAFLSGGNVHFDQTDVSYIGIFLTGMVTTYLGIYVMSLFRLLPFGGSKYNMRKDREEWVKHLNILVNKYSKKDITFKKATATIVILGGSVVLNYFFSLVSSYLLINAAIVLILQLNSVPRKEEKTLENHRFN